MQFGRIILLHFSGEIKMKTKTILHEIEIVRVNLLY